MKFILKAFGKPCAERKPGIKCCNRRHIVTEDPIVYQNYAYLILIFAFLYAVGIERNRCWEIVLSNGRCSVRKIDFMSVYMCTPIVNGLFLPHSNDVKRILL